MPVYQHPYGLSKMVVTSVLDAEGTPAGLVLEVGMTFAAGDLKVMTSHQIPTALTAELVAFTSGGTERPRKGDTLTGATSAATCVVIDTIITSGSWSGGDAAGFIFAQSVSGTFQSENLNNTTTGTSNVATIGADFTAGVGAVVASKSIAYALTGTEMECEWAQVEIVDATATEVWLEETERIETYGHPNALHQPEGNWFVLADGVVGGTGNDTTHAHLDGLTWGDDEVNHHMVVLRDISAGEWHARWGDDWVNSTELVTLATALPFTPVSGDLWAVLVFRRDTEPAALGSGASTNVVEAVESAALFTTALTESYATNGTEFTVAQALYQIWAVLAEFAVASSTMTAKKIDHSTTAMTFTLDDADDPTSITRAS